MSKAILYERIKLRRKQLGLTQDDLASMIGYSNRSAIARIENGSIDLPQSKIIAFADALKTTPGWLMGADKSNIKMVQIPLFENISCGTGMFIDDIPEDYITIPDRYLTKSRTYFANIAKGDSMLGKGIKEGDVLVFEQTNALDNGQIGSFCLNDKNYCKIFRRLNNGIILLESANDKYEPIIIDIANDDTCFRIIGRYKFKFSKEQ